MSMERPLVKLLRHTALDRGLNVSSGGYVLVDDIRKLPDFNSLTDEDVINACKKSGKQRLRYKNENDKLFIKAEQGHSRSLGKVLKDDELLTELKIEDADKYPVVVHGSFKKYDKLIQESGGLSVMDRKHVHFAIGLPGETGVISGMRKKCDRFYYLDLKALIESGVRCYISGNNVILSSGVNGKIGLKYLSCK